MTSANSESTDTVPRQPIQIPVGGGDAATDGMPAHLWEPEPHTGSGRPALVVLQEIFGVSDYITQRCADLAALGYVVVAPELYWRLDGVTVDGPHEDTQSLLEDGMSTMQRLDWDTTVADSLAALDYAAARPGVDRLGLIGFCFGGGVAFDAAARRGGQQPSQRQPDALVSYYGSALPSLTDRASGVTCPSLHHFGTADAFIPLNEVQRIRHALTSGGGHPDVEFHLHEGAGHAFDNPLPAFHHAQAAEQAWQQTRDFLTRHLNK